MQQFAELGSDLAPKQWARGLPQKSSPSIAWSCPRHSHTNTNVGMPAIRRGQKYLSPSLLTEKKHLIGSSASGITASPKLSWEDWRGKEMKEDCRGTSSNELFHPSSAVSICFKHLFSIKLTWKLVSSYIWENLFTSSFCWQKYCYRFSFLPALQSHLSTGEVNQSLFWHKSERTQLDLTSQGEFSVLAVKKVMVLFVN